MVAPAALTREEAGRPSQLQLLHLPQQTGAPLPGRFVREAALRFQTHGGRSSVTSSARGGGSTEGDVQGWSLVGGGAAGGAPAGLLVVRGDAGRRLSVSHVEAVAVGAAGAVDGADIMAVADITQRPILGGRRAVRQAKEVHRGVEAPPSTQPRVVCPAGADGAGVFLVTVFFLDEERAFKRFQ